MQHNEKDRFENLGDDRVYTTQVVQILVYTVREEGDVAKDFGFVGLGVDLQDVLEPKGILDKRKDDVFEVLACVFGDLFFQVFDDARVGTGEVENVRQDGIRGVVDIHERVGVADHENQAVKRGGKKLIVHVVLAKLILPRLGVGLHIKRCVDEILVEGVHVGLNVGRVHDVQG